MTVKERVLASRLIQKIQNNENYAKQIGLNYKVTTAGVDKESRKSIRKKEKS